MQGDQNDPAFAHHKPGAMPRIFRLYLLSALNGFGISLGFVALILVFNVANLRHLVSTSDIGIMATVAFWILNGIVFSGVQFAWALSQMVRADTVQQDALPPTLKQ